MNLRGRFAPDALLTLPNRHKRYGRNNLVLERMILCAGSGYPILLVCASGKKDGSALVKTCVIYVEKEVRGFFVLGNNAL